LGRRGHFPPTLRHGAFPPTTSRRTSAHPSVTAHFRPPRQGAFPPTHHAPHIHRGDATALKAFLEGADGKPARAAMWLGNIERSIVGPYYAGATATYVDYYLAMNIDFSDATGLKALEAKTKVRALAWLEGM
jgi:hypothetical protein